jgi:hypothetical protein
LKSLLPAGGLLDAEDRQESQIVAATGDNHRIELNDQLTMKKWPGQVLPEFTRFCERWNDHRFQIARQTTRYGMCEGPSGTEWQINLNGESEAGRRAGQALVEFVFVLPLLLMLLVGIIAAAAS